MPLFSAISAVLLAGFYFLAARGQPIEAIYRLIMEGGFASLWLLASFGWGNLLLRTIRVRCDSTSLRIATACGFGIGVMSLLILLLGLAGQFNRVAAWALIAVGLLLAIYFLAPAIRAFKFDRSAKPNWLILFLLPTLSLAVLWSFETPGLLWLDEPQGYDVTEYHLQVPREWYEAGRIAPLEHNVFSYFPMNVEMHYLLAMQLRGGPWDGMYLAQLMHALMFALGILALCSGANRLAGLLMASVPWLLMLAPTAYNEGGLLLFGTLAIVWTLRAIQFKQIESFLLAGALAGFACGCKLTGITFLASVPLVGLLLRAISFKQSATFVVAGLLAFSPWLIRNMLWAGNPVFPEAAGLLGRGHFSEEQVQRWQDAHSASPAERTFTGRLTATWRQLLADWRYGLVFFPLTLIAIGVSFRHPQSRLLIGLLLLQFIFWIGFTHLQGRFFLLAVPISAILIAGVELAHWRTVVTVAAACSACVGWISLTHRAFDLPESLGTDHYEPIVRNSILTPELASRIYDTSAPIALIGESRAFWFEIPMSRLRYRTVFDVNAKPGDSLIDAWAGSSVPAGANLIVVPSELNRLADHYSNLPPLTDEMKAQKQPYLLH